MIGILVSYARTARVQAAALVLFLTAGLLTQVPLFNYLGYEFSAVMTIPAALVSGILTIMWHRDHRSVPLTGRTQLLVIGDYLIVNALLLLLPLLIISFNAIAVKNCAYANGLLYYLLLPYGAMVFSVALALVVGTLFRKAITLFLLTITAILSHIVLITYFQPQLFAYNFILGFFPGITYDETLTDITSLIVYRQFTLIAALLLLTIFFLLQRNGLDGAGPMRIFRTLRRSMRKDAVLLGIAAFCALLLTFAHLFRDEMGFEYSSAEIREALGRRSESEHFIVYYRREEYSAEGMLRIKAEAEFHYRNLRETLKWADASGRKIELFIYPDSDWKQRYIGTANTNIAKPWNRQIHLTAATFEGTFRHELVHIAAGEFGVPIIRASLRMGMNEGLAVALDWNEGLFTPHQYAAAIKRINGLDQAEQLFTVTGFASQSSSYAYLVAGSFVRYLIDRYGIERVMRAFPNGNFMGTFGESLESLMKDWKFFLSGIDDSALPQQTVRSLFFQPSIFYKTCARTVADQNRRGALALRERDYETAEELFGASFANAPSGYALRGLFQSLNARQQQSEVVRRFRDLPERSALRSHPGVLLLLADAYYLDQRYDTAAMIYDSVRLMNFSPGYCETAALRKQCITDSLGRTLFYSLYYSGATDSARTALVNLALGQQRQSSSLLFLAAALDADDPAAAAGRFRAAAENSGSEDLQYYSLIRAAEQAYRAGRYQDAKGIFWQAKNFAPTVAAAGQLDEKIELCETAGMEW